MIIAEHRPRAPRRREPVEPQPPPQHTMTADNHGHQGRTALYVRVSTEEQAVEGYSLAEQERAGRLYVAARAAIGDSGWSEVRDEDVYRDPGVSGTLRDRPLGLNPLLAACAAGQYARVVCTKLDRIGRTAALILAVDDDLGRNGVERVYIKDGIDTSTATGRLLRTVLAAVAELERDMILERTRTGYEAKARGGDVFRSRHVYGYRYIPGDKRAGVLGRLEVHEPEAAVVRRIFRDLARGVSMTQLCVDLNTERVPTMRGGRWSHSTTRYILNNPVYLGRAAFGRTAMVVRQGQRVRRANPDPAAVHTIAGETIPALVDEPLAQAARAAVAGNRRFAARNARAVYMLRGVIRCATCGTTMQGATRAYKCHHTTPEGKPIPHRVGQRAIEEAVKGYLRRLVLADGATLRAQEEVNVQAERARAGAVRDLGRLEADVARATERRQRALDLYLDGGIDRAAWAAQDARLGADLAATRERVAALEAARDAAVARLAPTDAIRDLCREIAGHLDAFDDEAWQRLTRYFVREILVDPEAGHADVRGVLQVWDASGRGRERWSIMTPGYIPSPEEEEEAIQIILQVHAWMLGLPDPRERISLADVQPQPEPQPEPQPQAETPSAPEPGPAATRTPTARPRRPRTVA
jgi:site-specific DNA recombinase